MKFFMLLVLALCLFASIPCDVSAQCSGGSCRLGSRVAAAPARLVSGVRERKPLRSFVGRLFGR